jgi:hypothetical protein
VEGGAEATRATRQVRATNRLRGDLALPTPVGSSYTPQSRPRKYDFHDLGGEDIADGQVWRLDKGRDYDCSEANLRQHARAFAADHGLDFEMQRLKAERGITGVEIAFVPCGQALPAGLASARGRTDGQVRDAA